MRVNFDDSARNGCGFLCLAGMIALWFIAMSCGY